MSSQEDLCIGMAVYKAHSNRASGVACFSLKFTFPSTKERLFLKVPEKLAFYQVLRVWETHLKSWWSTVNKHGHTHTHIERHSMQTDSACKQTVTLLPLFDTVSWKPAKWLKPQTKTLKIMFIIKQLMPILFTLGLIFLSLLRQRIKITLLYKVSVSQSPICTHKPMLESEKRLSNSLYKSPIYDFLKDLCEIKTLI